MNHVQNILPLKFYNVQYQKRKYDLPKTMYYCLYIFKYMHEIIHFMRNIMYNNQNIHSAYE